MKNLIYLVAILTLIPAASLHAASGGGSSSNSLPQQQRVKLTPEQKAAERYEAGIKHRDKAAKYEQKAAGEKRERQLAKIHKKIDKEYNKSINDFEKAIVYFPHFFEVHGSLGYALRKVGRFEESLAAYNESLRINPDYGNAIEYRGEAYLGLNRIDDAKVAYMSLFQSDKALADQLLAAMDAWVTSRRENPDGLDAATVEQFADWVGQRSELASYIRHSDKAIAGLWAVSH